MQVTLRGTAWHCHSQRRHSVSSEAGSRVSRGHLCAHAAVLLLLNFAELLLHLAGLLRQLCVAQPHAGACLVDEIDGLVGQEAV